MAVIHRVHRYDVSVRADFVERELNGMMQGKNKHRTGLNSSEHIVSTDYQDGYWYIFTEEIIMGPVP